MKRARPSLCTRSSLRCSSRSPSPPGSAPGGALGVSFVASGGQVFGVIGSLVELIAGIDRGKAAGLRATGVDPTLAVTINLAYAAVSCCLFVVAITQMRLSAQRRTDDPS